MNKDTVLYAIIGLLAGIVITIGFSQLDRGYDRYEMAEKKKAIAEGRVMRVEDDALMRSGPMAGHEGASMDEMSAILKDKTGDDFDRAFIDLMIEHHQGAIDMANLIPARAKHDEIKKLGQDIIAAQTKEINDMETWAKEWGYDLDYVMPMMGR